MQLAIKSFFTSLPGRAGAILSAILLFLLKGVLGTLLIAWRYLALTIAMVFFWFGMYAETLVMFVVAFYLAFTDISDAINKQTEIIKYKGWK